MGSNFITLELDDDDYATIMAEVELRRFQDAENGESTMPDGDSDEIGAVIAEAIRDIDDYRAMYDRDHPPAKGSA